MRVATWNINGIRARLDFIRHWLDHRKPDVVALQELKTSDDDFPYLDVKSTGYHAACYCEKGWNGVAFFSRERPETVHQGLSGEQESGARLIDVKVHGLRFINVYCPNGKHIEHSDFPLKLRWFDSLASYLADRCQPDEALILGGDFNICPTPLDSWNEEELKGKIFHTKEERSRFDQLLKWGLIDLFRAQHPDLKAFSWWDYRAGAFHRNHGLRIDFLLATRPLAERLERVEIDREYRKKKNGLTASDHAPVWADLSD